MKKKSESEFEEYFQRRFIVPYKYAKHLKLRLSDIHDAFNAGRRAERKKTCQWVLSDSGDFYDTECGGAQCFISDGVRENKYKFCPYCGGKIVDRKGKR
jgi:hypothetical protein